MEISSNYTADSIGIETGMEPYRKRTEQYLGASDEQGIENQFFEVLDNAIDESIAYSALLKSTYGINRPAKISVTIDDDCNVTVTDNGRGFPCDWSDKHQNFGILVALENGSAGGKNRGTSGYDKVNTAGVHGAGITVALANSEYFEVETKTLTGSNTADVNDKSITNGIYKVRYEEGVKTQDLTRIGELDSTEIKNDKGEVVKIFEPGTTVRYRYSKETLKPTKDGKELPFAYTDFLILKRLKNSLIGQTFEVEVKFNFRGEETIVTEKDSNLVELLGTDRYSKYQIEYKSKPILDKDGNVSDKWVDGSYKAIIYIGLNPDNRIYGKYTSKSIVNRLEMKTSTTNQCIEKAIERVLLDIPGYNPDIDFQSYTKLCSCLCVMEYNAARYDAQTKRNMVSSDYMQQFFNDLTKELREKPDILHAVVALATKRHNEMIELEKLKQKAAENQRKAEEKAKKSKEYDRMLELVKTGQESVDILDKTSTIVVNASRYPKDKSTALIVEGTSVATTLSKMHQLAPDKKGYPIYIIGIKGKITNIIESEEDGDLVLAFKAKVLDAGFKDIRIMTDGDVDGTHIKVLVLSVIWKYRPDLIRNKKVFIVPSPYSYVRLPRVPMKIRVLGKIKEYTTQTVSTYSEAENNEIINQGGTVIKYYTGLSDTSTNPIEIITNESLHELVEPPTEQEVQLLTNMMTTGHRVKSDYTAKTLTPRMLRGSKMNSKWSRTDIKTIGDIRDNNEYSDIPQTAEFLKYTPNNIQIYKK